jgi:hypothetical protein
LARGSEGVIEGLGTRRNQSGRCLRPEECRPFEVSASIGFAVTRRTRIRRRTPLPARYAWRVLARTAPRRRSPVDGLQQAHQRRVRLGMSMDDDVYPRVVGVALTHVGDFAVERPFACGDCDINAEGSSTRTRCQDSRIARKIRTIWWHTFLLGISAAVNTRPRRARRAGKSPARRAARAGPRGVRHDEDRRGLRQPR